MRKETAPNLDRTVSGSSCSLNLSPMLTLARRCVSLAALAALLTLASNLQATNCVTSATQGSGASWLDAIWLPNGNPPTESPQIFNTYEILKLGSVRSPAVGGVNTFPGASLTIDKSATLRCTVPTPIAAVTLDFPGVGGNPGLILDGGTLLLGGTTNFTITGSMLVRSNSVFDIGSRAGGYTMAANVSGSNTISVVNAADTSLPFAVQSAANTFGGTWAMLSKAYLKGVGQGSLGRASILISNAAKFEVAYDIVTPGTLTLVATNSLMYLHQNCLFGAVTVTNYAVPAGTYTYADLVARFPLNFPAGGSGQITVLPPPSNVAATAGDGQVTVSWNSVTTATSYSVYRATVSGGPYTLAGTATGTSLVDPSLVNGNTYYYVVTSHSPGGESGTSGEVSATPVPPPLPPTGLAALNGDTVVTLTWNATANATGYYVKRATVKGGPYTAIATNGLVLNYVDTGLVNGNTYYYVVASFNGVGPSANSAEVEGKPNLAPRNLTAVGGVGQVTLTWTALSGATSYNVKRSGSSGGPYALVASGVTATTYVDTTAAAGADSYYVVSAEIGTESANSSEASAITAPAAPTGLVATPVSTAQILLEWASANDPSLTTFKIERSRDGTSFYPAGTAAGSATSFQVSGLVGATPYFFRVRASNVTGDSAYSTVAATTTIGFSLKVNFANGNSGTPLNNPATNAPGYLVDIGQTYAQRTNGMSYGWDTDVQSYAIWRRNVNSPDVRYDTLIQMQGGGTKRTWEAAVPTASYQVRVVGGEPSLLDFTNQFNIETSVTPSFIPSTSTRWCDFTNLTSVSDGRLTLTPGSGAYNSKISFVEIDAVPTPLLEIVSQPQNTNAVEGTDPSFSVATTGPIPTRYQWYFNRTNLLANRTNSTLVITNAQMAAQGIYSVMVYDLVGDTNMSVEAQLTLTTDTFPPYIVSATSDASLKRVTLVYNERMQAASATNKSNYTITDSKGNPLAVQSATLSSDTKTVVLLTDSQAAGELYTVAVSGVADASPQANRVADGTTVSFTSWVTMPGYLVAEVYSNIMTTEANVISSLTTHPKFINHLPDRVSVVTNMGFTLGTQTPYYGARVYGYFVPPSNGVYRFYIRSDDASQFWMTTNAANSADPSQKKLIVEETGCCNAYSARVSGGYALNGGQNYYMEMLMEQGTGGEYVYAAWREQGDTSVPPDAEFGGSIALVLNPESTNVVTLQAPQDVATYENTAVSFYVAAAISPTNLVAMGVYQWQKDGVDIPGATGPLLPGTNGITYTFPQVTLADDQSTFRCLFRGPFVYYASPSAKVTVTKDEVPPQILSVGSLNGWQVGVVFDEYVNPAFAGESSLYFVDDANFVNVTAAQVRPDGRSVLLTLDGQLTGPFKLEATWIYDLAGNVADSTIAFGDILKPAALAQDIGTGPGTTDPLYSGSTFVGSSNNVIEILAGGSDIGFANDACQFAYESRTSDFGVRAKVAYLKNADANAKAGLMFRETLDPNSRTYGIYTTPSFMSGGANTISVIGRNDPTNSAVVLATAALPVYSNLWLRLSRSGSTFAAFYSADGTNWTSMNTTLPSTPYTGIYAGLAATAHLNTGPDYTRAIFEDFEFLSVPIITKEPEPAVANLDVGQSVTFGGMVVECPDPVKYQWRKNGATLANQTAETLTINDLVVQDSGLYSVAVSSAGGIAISRDLALNVTNQPPTVVVETNFLVQNVTTNIALSELLANDVDPEGKPLFITAVSGSKPKVWFCNFDDGQPAGTALYGSAIIDSDNISASTNKTKVLRLTDAATSRQGWFVISNFSGGAPIEGFVANFDLLLTAGTSTPADGVCFCFSTNLPGATWTGPSAEDGLGSELSVCLDTYNNGSAEAPAFDIFWGTTSLAHVAIAAPSRSTYFPIQITLNRDGKVDVMFDGTNVFTGVQTPYVAGAGGFAMAARTGDATETHWIENLQIAIKSGYTDRGGQVTLENGYVRYVPPVDGCGWDYFYYVVSDGQPGGESVDTKWIFINETTPKPPEITQCATNAVLTPDTLPVAMPDLTAGVKATDNCCCVTITQSPAAGTMIGAGDHVVTFTATDAIGLTDTCTAVLKVVGSGLPALAIGQPSPDTVRLTWPKGTQAVRVQSTGDIGATAPVWTNRTEPIVTESDGSFSMTISGVSGTTALFFRLVPQ